MKTLQLQEKSRLERFFCFNAFVYRLDGPVVIHRRSTGACSTEGIGHCQVQMLLYIEAVPETSPVVRGVFLSPPAVGRFLLLNPPFFSRVTS